MHHIFGGPFHDQTTNDAFNDAFRTIVEYAPHLIVDTTEQQRGYASKFLDILKHHGKHKVFQVTPTMVKSSGKKIDILDILYPEKSPRIFPNSDWTNNPPKKRIPYFSGFRIGDSRG